VEGVGFRTALAVKPVGQRAKLLTDKMAKWPTAVGSRQKTSDDWVSASLLALLACIKDCIVVTRRKKGYTRFVF